MRRPALALALLASACRPRRPPPPPPPAPAAPRPAVVVTLVIDQFAAWIAAERLPLLPDAGGFARLRREGTWFREMRYLHAATDTAPGHASLYTGVPPRESGILANELVDERGERYSILRDGASRVVTFDGPTDGAGSSIAMLRVPTLADALRARVPDAVIVSVSLKDRGAIFGGGRRPDATLWFDPRRDSFVTSTAFAPSMPAWALPAGAPAALAALRAAPWTLAPDRWVQEHAASPDDNPGEGDLEGWGTTFPHEFTRARRAGSALRASPQGDVAVLDLAAAAVTHARSPGRPLLLAVSLSSNDYIGHLFGPDSWEAWDQLRRLDASLARFFERLDAAVGPRGWALVLSADHGIVTLPEAPPEARPWCAPAAPADPWERPCGPLTRLDPDALARELQDAAVAALGPGAWVRGVADPYVYLTPAALQLAPARRGELLAALAARARQHPEVERVVETLTVPAACAADESVEALLCRSIPADSGAALYVQTRAGAFFDAGYVLGRGASHGSPYRFDRAVPLFVRAPGTFEPGRRIDDPIPFTRLRASAERLLGL